MKLSERVYNYMPDDKKMKNYKKFNCAESMYRAILDHYNLDVSEDAKVQMSAFGGGLFMVDACGLLVGGYAALAQMFSVENPPHANDNLKYICRKWYKAFKEEFSDVIVERLNLKKVGVVKWLSRQVKYLKRCLKRAILALIKLDFNIKN